MPKYEKIYDIEKEAEKQMQMLAKERNDMFFAEDETENAIMLNDFFEWVGMMAAYRIYEMSEKELLKTLEMKIRESEYDITARVWVVKILNEIILYAEDRGLEDVRFAKFVDKVHRILEKHK